MFQPGSEHPFCRLQLPLIRGLLDLGFGFYHDRREPGIVRPVASFLTTAQGTAGQGVPAPTRAGDQ